MILLFFLSFKKIQILVGNCWRLKSLPFYKLPHCGVRIHFANFKSNSIYNYKSLIGILWIMEYRSLKKFLKNWKPNMSPVYRFLCDCIVCSMQSQNVFFQIWKIPRNLNYRCIENSEQLPRRRQSGVRMTYWSSVFFWALEFWQNESELWKSTKKHQDHTFGSSALM